MYGNFIDNPGLELTPIKIEPAKMPDIVDIENMTISLPVNLFRQETEAYTVYLSGVRINTLTYNPSEIINRVVDHLNEKHLIE